MKTQTQTQCDCGHVAEFDGITTGYGVSKDGKKYCFECCGELDRKQLREEGKLSGYFTNNTFSNWPGTLKLTAWNIRKSWHNMAGRDGRTDYDVFFEGKRYHGVHIGFSHECSTIKLCKS